MSISSNFILLFIKMFGSKKQENCYNLVDELLVDVSFLKVKYLKLELEVEVIKLNKKMESYGLILSIDGGFLKLEDNGKFRCAFTSIKEAITWFAGYEQGFGDIEIAINCDCDCPYDECIDNNSIDSIQDNCGCGEDSC